MAGGAGGAGGSPNGASGGNGSSSTGFVPGGTGGNNAATFTDGKEVFGPYGAGAPGSASNTPVGIDGKDGAVIITWGGGLAATA